MTRNRSITVLESLLSLPFIIGAVVGGLAVYVGGYMVGKERLALKALAYSVSSNPVIGGEEVPDLVVTFRGVPIRSMYAHQVVLRNVGTVALTNLSVQITSEGGRVRRPRLHPPAGAVAHYEPFTANGGFILTCDLLNRGEALGVNVDTIDPDDGTVTVVARDAELVVKSVPADLWQDASKLLDPSKLLDMVSILRPEMKVPLQIVRKLFTS
jgi:hypothetical protein